MVGVSPMCFDSLMLSINSLLTTTVRRNVKLNKLIEDAPPSVLKPAAKRCLYFTIEHLAHLYFVLHLLGLVKDLTLKTLTDGEIAPTAGAHKGDDSAACTGIDESGEFVATDDQINAWFSGPDNSDQSRSRL